MAVEQEPSIICLPKLVKTRALKQFLTKLSRSIGQVSYIVADHWDGDLTAIGVATPPNPGRLAYIRHTGRGRFYVSLELPPEPGSELPYSDAGTFKNFTAEQAIQAIKVHILPPST